MGNLGASGAGEFLLDDGSLLVADGLVRRWDGSQWVNVGNPDAGAILHLASFGGVLWGGATCIGSCGSYTGLYRLVGNTWTPVQPPPGVPPDSSFVTALAVHGGKLSVAWGWGSDYWHPHTLLAAFDGTRWGRELGRFEGGQIHDLADFRGRLCATGDFSSVAGSPVPGFAMLDSTGWDAHACPGGLGSCLAPTDSLLFAAGSGVASFDGAEWSYLTQDVNNVTALLVADHSLWVGGYFSAAAGMPSSGVARLDFPGASSTPPSVEDRLDARPNPSRSEVVIRFTMVRTGRAHISILDPMGREIATVLSAQKPQGDQSVTWNGQSRDGRAVPAGLYFVRLESEGVATRAHKLVRVR
jgi:hypothetical protein